MEALRCFYGVYGLQVRSCRAFQGLAAGSELSVYVSSISSSYDPKHRIG